MNNTFRKNIGTYIKNKAEAIKEFKEKAKGVGLLVKNVKVLNSLYLSCDVGTKKDRKENVIIALETDSFVLFHDDTTLATVYR